MGENATMINIKVFEDIGFVAIATKIELYRVEFEIYRIRGVDADGEILYISDCHPVSNISAAEIYLDGSVKWDGCSDWHIQESERCCVHGCSRGDLTAVGEVMARCWDWTAILCERWEGDLY